jgi:hypothetical protein
MKVEKINDNTYKFSELKSSKYGNVLCLGDDSTNCKLSYIHGIGNFNYISEEDIVLVINHCLQLSKGCVILNTTSLKIYKLLLKKYQVYYAHKVPIGYNDDFQYHVCIRNHININDYCKIPPKYSEEIKFTKKHIKTELIKILKLKRRKDDYVNEFIKKL